MKKRNLPATPKPRQEQGDLFAADTRYVLLLSALLTSGKAAEIGTVALAVLVCLRSHANYQTGRVSVGQRLIAQQIGVSRGAVSKALAKLEKHELIRRRASKIATDGRRPIYEIVEKIALFHDDKPAGDMSFPFQPIHMGQRLNEARAVVATGEVPVRSPIVLNLTINLIQNNGGTVVINEGSNSVSRTLAADTLTPSARAFFEKMLKGEPDA